jgi:hypothetical protein
MALGFAASGFTGAANKLATFRQQASTATHTHPYNYDWLWIVFVIAAVLVIGILIAVRFYAGRPNERSSQPQRDQQAEPEDSD